MTTMAQIEKDIEIADRVKFCCFCGKKLKFATDYKQKIRKGKVEIVCRSCKPASVFFVISRKLEEERS